VEYASISDAAHSVSDSAMPFKTRMNRIRAALTSDDHAFDGRTWERVEVERPVVAEPPPPRKEGVYTFAPDVAAPFGGHSMRWVEDSGAQGAKCFRAYDVLEVIGGLSNGSNSLRALQITHPAFFRTHTDTHRFYGQGNKAALVLSVRATFEFIGMLTSETTELFRRTALNDFARAVQPGGEAFAVVADAPVAPIRRTKVGVVRTAVEPPHETVSFATLNAAANSVDTEHSGSYKCKCVKDAIAARTPYAGYTWREVPGLVPADRRAVAGGIVHHAVVVEAEAPVGNENEEEDADGGIVETGEEEDADVEETEESVVEEEEDVEENGNEEAVHAEVEEEEDVEENVNEENVNEEEIHVHVAENTSIQFTPFNATFDGKNIRMTQETPKRISVFDLICAITHVKNEREVFRAMCQAYPEVVGNVYKYRFPGRGQRDTPVTGAKGAVTIVNLLPGPKAARFRAASAQILVRFLGGDETLVGEIRANANAVENADPLACFFHDEAVDPPNRGRRQRLNASIEDIIDGLNLRPEDKALVLDLIQRSKTVVASTFMN